MVIGGERNPSWEGRVKSETRQGEKKGNGNGKRTFGCLFKDFELFINVDLFTVQVCLSKRICLENKVVLDLV